MRSRVACASLCLAAWLSGCGGGGGGGGGDAALPGAEPQPLSALVLPVPPAASGDTIVQVRYQAQVRELVSQAGGPQLLASQADGSLQFSAAPGAQVGQVLLVAGRAYAVTSVDASGKLLGTRAPEMGEVFASLRVKASVQDASVAPAAGVVRPLAAAATTTSFTYELGALGPVGASYKGQLAMKLDLDLDFSAATGFKTLSLIGDLSLTQTLLLQLQTNNSDGSATTGIELKRLSYVIPQTLGLVRVDVPIMLQAQASGDAKISMRVIDGETRTHFELGLDPVSRQLLSRARIDSSAGSAAPTASALSPAQSAQSLGLNVKVGPDLQLKVLDSILPLSASLRGNLGVSAQLLSDGQRNCLGWKSELTFEGSAKLKLGSSGDALATLSTAPRSLGAGGDLAACQQAPIPAPTPTPTPPPTQPSVDGLVLLPLPAGAQALSGYRLVLAPDTWVADPQQSFYSATNCFDSTVVNLQTQQPETVHFCGRTLEPQLLGPDGSRIDVTTAAYQTWVARFDTAGNVSCALELFDPMLGLIRDGVSYTRRRGDLGVNPLWSRTPPNNGPSGLVYAFAQPSHNNQLTMVCQMELTERSTGQLYYLRTPLWTSPAGYVMAGASAVAWSNWLGN